MDVPERIQIHLRYQKRGLLKNRIGDEELEEEAGWIFAQHFQKSNLQRDLKKQVTIKAIKNALNHLLVDKDDHPHICKYRRESVAPLDSADIWQLMQLDKSWDYFSTRKKKLLASAGDSNAENISVPLATAPAAAVETHTEAESAAAVAEVTPATSSSN